MTVGCNIWLICLKLNGFFYDPSHVLQLSQFVWVLRSSVLVVFNSFLLTDATDKSKISSDQKRFFIALSLYPFHFSRTLPLKPYQSRYNSFLLNYQCQTQTRSRKLFYQCQTTRHDLNYSINVKPIGMII